MKKKAKQNKTKQDCKKIGYKQEPMSRGMQLPYYACIMALLLQGSLIPSKFDLKINRSLKTP